MPDLDLGKMLEPHKDKLKNLATDLAEGDSAKVIGTIAAVAAAVATGHPEVALLAPFAQKGVAHVFASSADRRLREAIEADAKDEQHEVESQAFAARIGDAIEALLGQAVLQLVRVQHRTKEEIVEALGGLRDDLAGFRADFQMRLDTAQRSGDAVRVEQMEVVEGAIGVRVGAAARSVAVRSMTVHGKGSVGIDLG